MIPARIHYRIPGLGLEARLVIFAFMALLGISLQIWLPDGGFLLGSLLLAAPLVLLSAKPWTNKPQDLGEEDWQPSGDAELDRIADNFRAAQKLRFPYWYRTGSGLPFTVVLIFLVMGFFVIDIRYSLFIFDAILLLWPVMHFLRIKVWVSYDFQLVMTAMQNARSIPVPSGLTVTPYLRLDRDPAGARIPEDARLMVEPRRKPPDLIGVQVQAAINKGPQGQVPYLYAVVITKGRGESFKKAAAWKPGGKLIVEVSKAKAAARANQPRGKLGSDGGDDYRTVVIRQKTSNKGYHTDVSDCKRLIQAVYDFLLAI